MWKLVKYPRFLHAYIVVEAFEHYPPYQELSTRMLTEGARPDKIPKLYLGGPVECEFHTFRMVSVTSSVQDAYWAEKDRERTLAKEFVFYNGLKGMSALSKADLAERLKHADQ